MVLFDTGPKFSVWMLWWSALGKIGMFSRTIDVHLGCDDCIIESVFGAFIDSICIQIIWFGAFIGAICIQITCMRRSRLDITQSSVFQIGKESQSVNRWHRFWLIKRMSQCVSLKLWQFRSTCCRNSNVGTCYIVFTTSMLVWAICISWFVVRISSFPNCINMRALPI